MSGDSAELLETLLSNKMEKKRRNGCLAVLGRSLHTSCVDGYTDTENNGNVFQYIFSKFFGWYHVPARVKRQTEPIALTQKKLKPGIYNLLNMYTGTTFKWLQYIDEDSEIADSATIKDQYIQEMTNVGLLSALLLTVWVTFLVASLSTELNWLRTAYYTVWSLATTLTLIATAYSVVMLMAITETSSPEEAEHFCDVMSATNMPPFIIGPRLPLFYFQIASLIACIGVILYFLGNAPTLYSSEAWGPIISVLVVGVSFIGNYNFLVSSLFYARQTDKLTRKMPAVDLAMSDISKLFAQMREDSSVLSSDIEEEDFLDYIQEHVTLNARGFAYLKSLLSNMRSTTSCDAYLKPQPAFPGVIRPKELSDAGTEENLTSLKQESELNANSPAIDENLDYKPRLTMNTAMRAKTFLKLIKEELHKIEAAEEIELNLSLLKSRHGNVVGKQLDAVSKQRLTSEFSINRAFSDVEQVKNPMLS